MALTSSRSRQRSACQPADRHPVLPVVELPPAGVDVRRAVAAAVRFHHHPRALAAEGVLLDVRDRGVPVRVVGGGHEGAVHAALEVAVAGVGPRMHGAVQQFRPAPGPSAVMRVVDDRLAGVAAADAVQAEAPQPALTRREVKRVAVLVAVLEGRIALQVEPRALPEPTGHAAVDPVADVHRRRERLPHVRADRLPRAAGVARVRAGPRRAARPRSCGRRRTRPPARTSPVRPDRSRAPAARSSPRTGSSARRPATAPAACRRWHR